MSDTLAHDFTAETIDGQPQPLSAFKGRLLLVVNTASACGLTPQFAGLETLWKDLQARGLTVIGFPSNEFAGQDPGTNEEIAAFCQSRYGVSFLIGRDGRVLQRFEPTAKPETMRPVIEAAL